MPPAAATRAAASPLDGAEILVVDDDADGRELLAAVLGGCGANVRTAQSVVEAMAELDRAWPHVS